MHKGKYSPSGIRKYRKLSITTRLTAGGYFFKNKYTIIKTIFISLATLKNLL